MGRRRIDIESAPGHRKSSERPELLLRSLRRLGPAMKSVILIAVFTALAGMAVPRVGIELMKWGLTPLFRPTKLHHPVGIPSLAAVV